MKDSSPSRTASEGPEPQPDIWQEVTSSTPEKDKRIYPGEGIILKS